MRRRPFRSVGMVVVTAGCLFAGPCGITTLQFKDFLTSSLIQTGVTTLASVFEAATVDAAQDDSGDNGGG